MKKLTTRRALLAGGGAIVLVRHARAGERTAVDLKLVLALDVSDSVNPERWKIQKEGYSKAFLDPDVLRANLSGPIGAIAVAVVQWSGRDEQKVVVPWFVINGPETAAVFSHALLRMPRVYSDATSIGGVLEFTSQLLFDAPFSAPRSVIDISGDGSDRDPPIRTTGPVPLSVIRAEVLARDPLLTINGLAIHGAQDEEVPNLYQYYEDEVIGGPGAFVLAVDDANRLDLVAEGVKRKLVREIMTS